MLLDLDVNIDTSVIERLMHSIPKEIPFAISLSLTWTGRAAVPVLQNTVYKYFTKRTGELSKRMGYYMTRRGDQEIRVGSKSWYMALQATGGERKGKDGGNMGIPVLGGARKNAQSITRPSRWAGKLDDPGTTSGKGYTGDYFTGEVKTKIGMRLGTWKRVARSTSLGSGKSKIGDIIGRGRWRGEEARTGLQLMYWFKDSATIPARWPVQEIVTGVVAREWPAFALKAVAWTFENPNKRAARPSMKLRG